MSVHDRKNLKSALESAILYLQKQGVEEARQDAWLLLEHVCGISHSTYFVHSEDEMPKEQQEQYSREQARPRDFKAHITALHDSRIETETRRIVDKLKDLSAPNSPNKTHFMVEISPHFDALAQQTLSKLERMTDTDYDNQKFNFTDE